jgi:antitoxin (DNA-binding transcriptional repressor) of toxin-antitoxin stability system
MRETLIGVRQLQRETSRVVRAVEEAGAVYRVAVRGRPTQVMVMNGAASPGRSGASVAEARASALYSGLAPAVAELWAAQVDAARDAEGRLGGDS